MKKLKESKRTRRSSLREHSREDKVLFEALTEEAFGAYSEEVFFEHVNRDWYEGTSLELILNKWDRENNWKGLLQGKIKDITFMADDCDVDVQEDLVFYDEDGNVIHDVYALLYDTDEVFNESKRTRRSSLREHSRNDKVLFEATENAFDAYSEPFFDHVNRDWFDGLPYAEHLEFNKEDRENNWKGLLQGKIRDIIFIANEAEIDPQEELIFYDEDGNVIHDAYALLYDTDEVFNESKRTRRSSLREHYQDFDYAYYKTKRIANSLCKEFDCETVKYAFGRVSEEL